MQCKFSLNMHINFQGGEFKPQTYPVCTQQYVYFFQSCLVNVILAKEENHIVNPAMSNSQACGLTFFAALEVLKSTYRNSSPFEWSSSVRFHTWNWLLIKIQTSLLEFSVTGSCIWILWSWYGIQWPCGCLDFRERWRKRKGWVVRGLMLQNRTIIKFFQVLTQLLSSYYSYDK